jgi:hypothetical protein
MNNVFLVLCVNLNIKLESEKKTFFTSFLYCYFLFFNKMYVLFMIPPRNFYLLKFNIFLKNYFYYLMDCYNEIYIYIKDRFLNNFIAYYCILLKFGQ